MPNRATRFDYNDCMRARANLLRAYVETSPNSQVIYDGLIITPRLSIPNRMRPWTMNAVARLRETRHPWP